MTQRSELLLLQVREARYTEQRNTSHVTHHASHITHHTSHVTRHTSHVTRHTPITGGSAANAYTVDLLVRCINDSQPPKPLADPSSASWQGCDGAEIVTLPLVAIAAFTQVSEVVHGTEEHVTRHASHVTRHTSHVTRHTSHVT